MQGIGFILFSMLFFGWTQSFALDDSTIKTSRIEVIITVAGVKETVASIEQSSQQIADLTQQLSNKKDFTSKDHELITALIRSLNNNAEAINNIATALPKQFDNAQAGITTVLNTAMTNTQDVISSSKNDLIDPTLSRIENRLLILVLIIAAVLFGLLWFGLWRLRAIVSTGSKTISNLASMIKSLETVVSKVNKTQEQGIK